MPQVDVLSMDGQKAGTVSLPDELFGARVCESAVHSAVVAYETNQRQGNASVKGRSEVVRSKKKHHRQKGTGQARRGTVSAPGLRGGGVAFALPKPRSYRSRLPRSLKRLALRSVLTAKGRDGQVFVVDRFELSEPSTKAFVALLDACGLTGRRVLFVTASHAPVLVRSARNIPRVQIRCAETVGTYDVLSAQALLLTQSAIAAMARVHGDGKDGE